MTGDTLQTEFPFTLPNGFVGDDGTLHREGTMRLATAADEILPLKDPRVRSNESYLTVILLSRVVTRLGSLPDVTPQTVENLFVADLAYLQDMYERVNDTGMDAVDATCPDCGESFAVDVGSSTAGPGADHAPTAAVVETAGVAADATETDGGTSGNPRSPTAESRSGDGVDSTGRPAEEPPGPADAVGRSSTTSTTPEREASAREDRTE